MTPEAWKSLPWYRRYMGTCIVMVLYPGLVVLMVPVLLLMGEKHLNWPAVPFCFAASWAPVGMIYLLERRKKL